MFFCFVFVFFGHDCHDHYHYRPIPQGGDAHRRFDRDHNDHHNAHHCIVNNNHDYEDAHHHYDHDHRSYRVFRDIYDDRDDDDHNLMTMILTTMMIRSNSFLPFHSSALFSVDPLTSVRRSFQVKIIIVIIIITIIIIVIVIIINIIMIMRILQDIQAGVGRSMRSLMAAGSAIGHRMLGMITRAPSIIVIVVVIVIIFILIIIMFLIIIRTALPCAPLVLLWPSPSGKIRI